MDQRFTTTKTTTLSGAAEVITIQHGATWTNAAGNTVTTKNVRFISAYLYSTVAATITLERSGTAATSTAQTISNLNPNNPLVNVTTSQAFNTSNVGVGTVMGVYQFNATTISPQIIDLSAYQLPAGVADNLTFRTNSITGTVQIMVVWQEM